MGTATRVKESGSVLLGCAAMVAMSAIGTALIFGAATFSVWVLKWTIPAFAIAVLVSLTVLAPLSLLRKTRGFAAVGFIAASFTFAAILWLWTLGYTYTVWGLVGVLIGLALFGGGVILLGLFAALVHGDWGNLAAFAITGVLAIGCRVLAHWLAKKVDERAQSARSAILASGSQDPDERML